jgi:hypothetical protein
MMLLQMKVLTVMKLVLKIRMPLLLVPMKAVKLIPKKNRTRVLMKILVKMKLMKLSLKLITSTLKKVQSLTAIAVA